MPAIPRDTLLPLPSRSFRHQQTLAAPVRCEGTGFLTGASVTLELHPAAPDHGIAFQRVDCAGTLPIPAARDSRLPRQRRTAIGRGDVVIELIEHVMAALAGLQIDNCLVRLDAPEPPGFDGSSQPLVEAILAAGTRPQGQPRMCLMVDRPFRVGDGTRGIRIRPLSRPGLAISYHLDYGPGCPIPPQNTTCRIEPHAFVTEIASARTFVLQAEASALQAEGFGKNLTHRDLLVYGPSGPIDNPLHFPDECARHKILDLVGDLAFLGCDLAAHVDACCSGHDTNHLASDCLADASSELFLRHRAA